MTIEKSSILYQNILPDGIISASGKNSGEYLVSQERLLSVSSFIISHAGRT